MTSRPNTEWACLMWQALVARATTRRTVTYGELAKDIGYGAPNLMSGPLELIFRYCKAHQCPDLTVLVVTQATGKPGDGNNTDDVDAEREWVFAHPWFQWLPVTLEGLA